jgi:hypothetical protein
MHLNGAFNAQYLGGQGGVPRAWRKKLRICGACLAVNKRTNLAQKMLIWCISTHPHLSRFHGYLETGR